MHVKNEEFNYWKNRSADDFNYWMKNCQGKSIKKQIKILNNKEKYLGIHYILGLLNYSSERAISLFVVKLILKKYSIEDNEFNIIYHINKIEASGLNCRIKLVLDCFPLIENDLIKHIIKLIKKNKQIE